jgi:hypothetical protein
VANGKMAQTTLDGGMELIENRPIQFFCELSNPKILDIQNYSKLQLYVCKPVSMVFTFDQALQRQ